MAPDPDVVPGWGPDGDDPFAGDPPDPPDPADEPPVLETPWVAVPERVPVLPADETVPEWPPAAEWLPAAGSPPPLRFVVDRGWAEPPCADALVGLAPAPDCAEAG